MSTKAVPLKAATQTRWGFHHRMVLASGRFTYVCFLFVFEL